MTSIFVFRNSPVLMVFTTVGGLPPRPKTSTNSGRNLDQCPSHHSSTQANRVWPPSVSTPSTSSKPSVPSFSQATARQSRHPSREKGIRSFVRWFSTDDFRCFTSKIHCTLPRPSLLVGLTLSRKIKSDLLPTLRRQTATGAPTCAQFRAMYIYIYIYVYFLTTVPETATHGQTDIAHVDTTTVPHF